LDAIFDYGRDGEFIRLLLPSARNDAKAMSTFDPASFVFGIGAGMALMIVLTLLCSNALD